MSSFDKESDAAGSQSKEKLQESKNSHLEIIAKLLLINVTKSYIMKLESLHTVSVFVKKKNK